MNTRYDHLFKNHFTLVINETTSFYYADAPERDASSAKEFRINTRKLQEWLHDEFNHHAFNYVERIFELALTTESTETTATRKFSLGDTEEWWGSFLIEGDEPDVDPIRVFYVDIEHYC